MINSKRLVAVFSGNRAEYGLLYPILRAIKEHPDLDYRLIVSGAHLDANFGQTITEIKDGTFQTACSNACTTGAMVFGDINDKESKVAALHEDDRMYHLLESVGTKPNVMYHVKVRNTDEV